MLWHAPPGPRGTAWGTHQTASSVQPGDGWKAGDVTTNEETNLGGTALMRGDRSEHPAGERAPEAPGGRAAQHSRGPRRRPSGQGATSGRCARFGPPSVPICHSGKQSQALRLPEWGGAALALGAGEGGLSCGFTNVVAAFPVLTPVVRAEGAALCRIPSTGPSPGGAAPPPAASAPPSLSAPPCTPHLSQTPTVCGRCGRCGVHPPPTFALQTVVKGRFRNVLLLNASALVSPVAQAFRLPAAWGQELPRN